MALLMLETAAEAGHRVSSVHSPAWFFYLALATVFVFVLLAGRFETQHSRAARLDVPRGHRLSRSIFPPIASHAELLVTIAALSAAAAAIHASVARPHFGESKLFGLLFLIAAVGQAVWAVLALRHPSRALLLCGATANAGIVAVWVLSRTTGVPLGPEPWTPEAVQPLDVVATLCELAIVGFALALLRRETTFRSVRLRDVTSSGLVLGVMVPIAAVALVIVDTDHH
jgi:hypothetical protein